MKGCIQNKRLFKRTRLLHLSVSTEAQLVKRISLNFDYILFQNKQQQKTPNKQEDIRNIYEICFVNLRKLMFRKCPYQNISKLFTCLFGRAHQTCKTENFVDLYNNQSDPKQYFLKLFLILLEIKNYNNNIDRINT